MADDGSDEDRSPARADKYQLVVYRGVTPDDHGALDPVAYGSSSWQRSRESSVASQRAPVYSDTAPVPPPFCASHRWFAEPIPRSKTDLVAWLTRRDTSPASITSVYLDVAAHMKIVYYSGDARNQYAGWVVRNAAAWFRAAGCDHQVLRKMREGIPHGGKAENIILNSFDAGPFGMYLRWFVCEPRRRLGFFIQLYGRENAFPCKACDIKQANAGGEGSPGMAPFFGCKSIVGGYHGDASCGNCAVTTKGAECSFQSGELAWARARSGCAARQDIGDKTPADFMLTPEDTIGMLKSKQARQQREEAKKTWPGTD